MRMIALPDACYVAQRPYSQLYAMALRGRLGAKRIGARWFVSEAACLALDEGTPRTGHESPPQSDATCAATTDVAA